MFSLYVYLQNSPPKSPQGGLVLFAVKSEALVLDLTNQLFIKTVRCSSINQRRISINLFISIHESIFSTLKASPQEETSYPFCHQGHNEHIQFFHEPDKLFEINYNESLYTF